LAGLRRGKQLSQDVSVLVLNHQFWRLTDNHHEPRVERRMRYAGISRIAGLTWPRT
jgi:hypothetical protein